MPLDTHVSVLPDAEPLSVPEPETKSQRERTLVQNSEPVPFCRLQ